MSHITISHFLHHQLRRAGLPDSESDHCRKAANVDHLLLFSLSLHLSSLPKQNHKGHLHTAFPFNWDARRPNKEAARSRLLIWKLPTSICLWYKYFLLSERGHNRLNPWQGLAPVNRSADNGGYGDGGGALHHSSWWLVEATEDRRWIDVLTVENNGERESAIFFVIFIYQ